MWIVRNDELYHWGVKGMKWRKRKNPQAFKLSAQANQYKNFADSANMLGANAALSGNFADANEFKKLGKKARNTQHAIEKGRPAPRDKNYTNSYQMGKGLYKRGKVKDYGNTSQLGRDKKARKKKNAKKFILSILR